MKLSKYWLFLAFSSFSLVLPPCVAETLTPAAEPAAAKNPEGAPKTEGIAPRQAPVNSDGWEGGESPKNPGPIPVAPPVPFNQEKPSRLASFQLDGLLFIQNGGSNCFTGQVAWTPIFKISRYEMRGEFGLSVPKSLLGDLYIALNYELFFRTQLGKELRVDLGGGAETFTAGNGGTKPILTVQLSKLYDIKAPVNTIFVAYSAYFATRLTHIFKAGIGFTL